MTFALTLVTAVVLGVLLLLALMPLLQTIAATTTPRDPVGAARRQRLALLVPAHDEAAGIGETLASLLPQLQSGDRLVVIADNCSDDTAAVARASGAEVVERTDATHRGKGYALAHGFRHIALDPPAVVLMFDADCVAGPGCVARLAEAAIDSGHPVQSLYLLRAVDRSVRARLSEFALRLRNHARPLGMRRLGLPCQLMGSGMAFRWSILQADDLASGHLAEDLQLGLRFARRGLAPIFCPGATVDSRLAGDASSAVTQRTRWEHGHLGIIVAELPSLLATAVRRRDGALLMLAWDLAVPPFALFTAVAIVVAAIASVVAVSGGPAWPLAGAALVLAMTMTTMVVTQRRFARDLISLREILVTVPLYLVGKIPVYLRFIVRRQVEWVRTKRDAG